MKLMKILVVMCSILLGVSSLAADLSPLAMLKSTSNQMLQELDKNIGRLKGNNKLVYGLVDRILVPHFDLLSMSRALVGRNYWQQASSNTQRQIY